MIKRKLKTDQLEAYLERAKWEYTDLTTATNISPLALSNWLSRSHGPTPRMMDKITAAINNRYIQLGLLVTITREDILDEVLSEVKHKIWKPKREAVTRFWSKVDRRESADCWNWTGGKNGGGYGSLTVKGEHVLAHRFAWEITHSPIPDRLLCLHKCDRPPCVNPNHLYIGTHGDNMRDKMERYRKPDENALSLFFNRYPF